MGSTPAKPATDGLAGGPRTFTGMAPIPNPGDLSKADRVKFYGHKYDYLPEPKGKAAVASSGAPRFQLVTRRKSDGTLQISMRPIANPEDMTAAERRRVYGNRYAPRAVAATPRRGWRTAPAPTPVVKPVVKPVVVAKVAPAPAVKPAPKPVAVAPKLNPTQQLQTAVSPEINRGASLSVPADLKAGKEADVVLSLPGDLLAMVQAQAAKLGLGKQAKKVSAYANLQGQGYDINPPGQQTAPVAAGKPTTFTWKVKPTAAEKSPLKADYGLELNGAKPKTAFSVGSVEEFVAAPVVAAKDAAKRFKWPSLKMPKIPSLKALAFPWVPEYSLPIVGKVARENTVGGALALLALILLIVVANGASASRARNERRRKFRTMKDYGVNEVEPDAHHTAYVNPMIAAAGAAGGYALASHGHDDHHDDHGHGHDDHGHGHDDHAAGHDDHGHGQGHVDHGAHHASHDAHGHDDHGHGHDDHAAGHDDHGHGQGHDDHGAHHTSHEAHGHGDHGHGHDDHGHGDGHGHDEHGHGHDDHAAGHGHDDHGAHHTATPTSHGHDDHGHGHDDHGDGHGHDEHGHGDGHGHDDHGHGPAQHIAHTPVSGHDDHGHGHDDHGHGHDSHGHDDHHGHDEHHKEPEHAH